MKQIICSYKKIYDSTMYRKDMQFLIHIFRGLNNFLTFKRHAIFLALILLINLIIRLTI